MQRVTAARKQSLNSERVENASAKHRPAFDIIVAVVFAVGDNDGEGIEDIVPILQYVSIANDRLHLDDLYGAANWCPYHRTKSA